MAKGIAVRVLTSGVKRERLLPINHAPGSPKASETSTLKNACLKVKRVMLKRASFCRTVNFPFTSPLTAGAKLAAYGRTKEKAAARTGGSANRQAADFLVILSRRWS